MDREVCQRSLFRKIAYVFPYIWRQKKRLAAILVLSILSAGLATLLPWPLKFLVDHVLTGGEFQSLGIAGFEPSVTGLILISGVSLLVLATASLSIDSSLSWIWTSAGHRMLYDLAAAMFSHLQRLSLLYHGSQRIGDLLSRITEDSWCVFQISAQLLVSPVRQIFLLAAIGFTAWVMNPLLTIIMFAVSPALAWSVHFFGTRLKNRSADKRVAEARMSSFSQQVLSAIPIVQTMMLEPRNSLEFGRLGDEVVQKAQRSVLALEGFTFVNGAALAAGAATIIFFGSLFVQAGEMTVGSLLVFIVYTGNIRAAISALLGNYGRIRQIEASIDRVIEVMDAEVDVADRPGATDLHLSSAASGAEIRFENVHFVYKQERPALRGVDLTIEPGEKIALIGGSGAGKTTLASLIPRLFDPTSGRVLIDGCDLREIKLSSLRAKVALVLQEPFLLPLSIAENIAFGRPDTNFDMILNAAKAANADEFIEKLPDGYQTVIGERGQTLSGGQRQRIAIARALIKDAPIIILDEPTSAVDRETEDNLLTALDRLMTGRTAILIAHRLSTVRNATRIVVMENGQIVESGTEPELIAARANYWRFRQLQSESSGRP